MWSFLDLHSRNGTLMIGHDIMKISFFKQIGTEEHRKCKLQQIQITPINMYVNVKAGLYLIFPTVSTQITEYGMKQKS